MDAGLRITHFSHIERLEEIGVVTPIETVGKSYDSATSKSMCAILKTELFRNNAVHNEIGGLGRRFQGSVIIKLVDSQLIFGLPQQSEIQWRIIDAGENK